MAMGPPGMPYPMQMPFPGAPGGGFPPMMAPQPYGGPASAPKKPKLKTTALCTIHPPGMPRAFDVPFPERKLAVCIRCKKNYRSRELCRQRDEHKALPWQTTYVVVTLTDAVLTKGEDGKLDYADIPVAAELQEMPDLCRGPSGGFMSKEPICNVCKQKNYTRDYCRNNSKHTTPPYQSVYVKLVPKMDEGGGHRRPAKRKKRKPEENADGKPRPDPTDPDSPDPEEVEEYQSDDLTEIHESKTFFAAISSKKIVVKWCEQIHYTEVAAEVPAHVASMMPPPMMNMGNVPNMQMQSQLWEAFRAGAMWAQTQQGGHQMPGGHMPQMPQAGQMPPGYGHHNEAPPQASMKSPMV